MSAPGTIPRSRSSPKSPQQYHDGASIKAVLLMDEVLMAGEKQKPRHDAAPVPSPAQQYVDDDEVVEGEHVHDMRSEHALTLERGANMKALLLLDKTVAGVAPAPTTGVKTARQAISEQYEKRKQEKRNAKNMVKAVKMYDKETRPAKLVAEKKLEKMATTTRKIKIRPEDVRDPDTVAGMKSELEVENEKDAKEKALKMMDEQDTGLV